MNQRVKSQIKTIGWVLVFVLFLAMPAAAGERLAIGVSVANIRSGPGQDYDILWKTEKYTPIEVLDRDQSGDWIYFQDYEGTKAWIHKNLVRDIDAVITKKGTCNIRSRPGKDHDLRFQAEKGVPFKVMRRKGDWIQIKHADGDTGWIYKDLVW
ncbi:MAG: SH3 domain-containing protein [Desulfobacterales bacterium]